MNGVLAEPTGAADGSPPTGGDTPTYEVAELLGELTETVEAAFPDEIWIRGQIRNLSKSRKGHVYFDLATPAAADRNPQATLPVVLFDWYRKIVNRILGPGAAGHMTEGVEVRIRGRLSVYKARGQLQLQMRTIDPGYTLSRLADERDRLLGELAAAGLLQRNKALPLPTLPLRVGLVTSAGSAAAGDFGDVLATSGIGWELLVVDTPVQGFGSEQRIAEALRLAEQHGAELIALVRGGGARTELAPFDSAAVAHAIAARSVPVLTGIGHEIDRSVADLVAHTACNTPTACATTIVERVRDFERATAELWGRIQRTAVRSLENDRRRLGAAARQTNTAGAAHCRSARRGVKRLATDIDRAVRHAAERAGWQLDGHRTQAAERAALRLTEQRHTLAGVTDRLRLDLRQALTAAGRRLDTLEAQLHAYDPQRALDRGWSITSDGGGRLLRSVSEVTPGATLRTRMRDGTVTSTAAAVSQADTTGGDHD